jgi:hypothetical protein
MRWRNTRACAAVKAVKDHPDFQTFLPVGRTGKNAGDPIRAAIIKLAQAVFNNKPESEVRAAAQKLFSDCQL